MKPARRPISIMSPDLALKIAAGEVVERPAAAVKELIDNAIDAGASSVKVEVRGAGLKLIRVSDDGHGIPRAEVPLAFQSHATSKIGTLDDLEHLTTLGFRGEALPSIAAVARVEIQTQAAEEEVGTRLVVEHGALQAHAPASTPVGTRIAVWDLFANVPARRKFVRSLRAEVTQIQTVLMQYALAQPAVQLLLTVDGQLTFQSPGTGRLGDAIAAVYGAGILDAMTEVEAEDASVRVHGLVSTPGLSRQHRTAITIFVNGRPVQNRSLGFVLEEAYSGYLMTGRHPVAAVHLAVPPDEVDVNIHPSKREVRFAREREVHAVLHRAVADALLSLRMDRRDVAPAPGTALLDWAPLPTVAPLPAEPAAAPSPLLSGLPMLRVFGQSNQAFIIAEGPDGLYMIDQHAAHERILFDRLDQQLSSGTAPTQPLLQPVALDLTPEQTLALEENRDLLEQIGFVLEPFGNDACLIRAVPALPRPAEPTELVAEVLGELRSLPEPGAARERALAAVACKAAVKAGQTLDPREMRELVTQLERTLRPSTCPHGRPTMIHLSHSQLEREFGRR